MMFHSYCHIHSDEQTVLISPSRESSLSKRAPFLIFQLYLGRIKIRQGGHQCAEKYRATASPQQSAVSWSQLVHVSGLGFDALLHYEFYEL